MNLLDIILVIRNDLYTLCALHNHFFWLDPRGRIILDVTVFSTMHVKDLFNSIAEDVPKNIMDIANGLIEGAID